MTRLVVLGAACAALLAAGAGSASAATEECRGLMVCVPIAGPWVVLPTSTAVPRARIEYQLSCPKRYVVGGLDAELSDPSIDVGFLATLGSPVTPGVTTSQNAVLFGMYVGGGRPAASYRPHVGCLPATGGGARVRTGVTIYRVGQPTVRHVRTVQISPGAATVAATCARGERLVYASHAIGFYTSTPPPAGLARSVTAQRAIRGDGVVVSVHAGGAIEGVRAVVQVSAICARTS